MRHPRRTRDELPSYEEALQLPPAYSHQPSHLVLESPREGSENGAHSEDSMPVHETRFGTVDIIYCEDLASPHTPVTVHVTHERGHTRPTQVATPATQRDFKLLSPFVICFLIIVQMVAVGCCAIGTVHYEECAIEPRIPQYLIALGFGICALAGGMVLLGNSRPTQQADVCVSAFFSVLKVCTIIGFVFVICWYSLGNMWIITTLSSVTHEDPDANTFCDRTMYVFTVSLNGTILLIMVMGCCLANQIRHFPDI